MTNFKYLTPMLRPVSQFTRVSSRFILEIICILLCIMYGALIVSQYKTNAKECMLLMKQPLVNYKECDFQSGDLLILFKPHMRPLHPGHLALVVKLTSKFDQLCVWELDPEERTNVLTPMYLFLQDRQHNHAQQIFWRKINIHIKTDVLLQGLRPYTNAKYDYRVTIAHINAMLREYVGLPGIPGHEYDSHGHYYCATVILKILVDIGICNANILQLGGTIFSPSSLLMDNTEQDVLNSNMLYNIQYASPKRLRI